jgi:hypothetical protein
LMAEPDGVDGRHKAGHDGGGSPSTVIAISGPTLSAPDLICRPTLS